MNFSESSDGGNSLFSPVKRLMNQIFKYRKNNDSNIFEKKNIDFWKKRENILLKRKKLCKTLKRLRNQKAQTEKIVFENSDFFTPLSEQKNSKTENRQKRDKNLNDFISANSSRSWENYQTQKGTSSNIAIGQNAPSGFTGEQKSFDFFGLRSASTKIRQYYREKIYKKT